MDAEGNAVELEGPSGARHRCEYDAFGNQLRRTDPLGNEVTFKWDAAGLLTATTRSEQLPGGHVLALTHTFKRDADGRPVSAVDGSGRAERWSYDGQGRLRSAELPDGTVLETSYDVLGRPALMTTTADGGQQWTERVEYAPSGAVTALVDAAGRRTAFERDAAGRVTRVVGPQGQQRGRYAYDVLDNVTRAEDPRGVVVTQRFDALSRIVARDVTAPTAVLGARHEAFAYDALGTRRSCATTSPPSRAPSTAPA